VTKERRAIGATPRDAPRVVACRVVAPRVIVLCLVLLALVALCGACGSRPATRVLFIGNSFTSYNGGLDTLLAGLAPSCATASFDQGGFTLEEHWDDAAELHSIATGHWDYVVLQDQSQSPVVNSAEFRRYTLLFDHAIARSGAKTVLLMTWDRPDSAAEGVTTANLSAAYRAAGAALGARVAPAGEAFAEALLERPDLVLYNPDGHPTRLGSYLAACVVYDTVFGHSAIGLTYSDPGMSAELRTFLQKVAAESLVSH
jgi:hypothetical protein